MKTLLTLVIILLGVSSCTDTANKTSDKDNVSDKKVVIHESYKKVFLTSEQIFSQEMNDTISQLTINNTYAVNIPEDEKAAIAYILTFIDNGCNWENNQVNAERNNLLCKGLSALGLSYQCSEKHISFLTKWFSADPVSLIKIEDCPHTFPGVTIHTSIKNIKLERTENQIIVIATKKGYNSRRQESFTWLEKYEFRSNGKSLVLTNMQAGERKLD